MSHNETFNNYVLLDRLVDGELTGIERRQLLESLDERPEGWRRCAMAFLEAQSWREELGQVARGSHLETNEPRSPASFAPHIQKSHWAAGAKWFALAASFLLAFGLGFMQRERGMSVAGVSSNSGDQIASVSPPANSQSSNGASPKGTAPDDALTLFVKDSSGRMQPVRVPLVDASTLDKQLGVQFQTGVPDDIRNQLKDSGYAVKSKRQYAPLWFENGRPMIVPVEDTNIVPVSNRVY